MLIMSFLSYRNLIAILLLNLHSPAITCCKNRIINMCTGFYLQINEIINNYKRNFNYINLECRSYQNRICSSYLICSGMYCILKIDMLGVSWEIMFLV